MKNKIEFFMDFHCLYYGYIWLLSTHSELEDEGEGIIYSSIYKFKNKKITKIYFEKTYIYFKEC